MVGLVLGAGEGAVAPGLGSVWSGGFLVLGVWHVEGATCPWPGISLIIRVKGLICEKATAALNKAGVVCACAPLGWWLL